MKKTHGVLRHADSTAPAAEQRAGSLRRRARRNAGLSLLELIIALGLFAMVLLMFGAAFPQALKGGGKASSYMQASLICQHKIDQLRQAGYSHVAGPTAASDLQVLGIVDTVNGSGSYSFTKIDNLVDNGSNKGLFGAAANASGTIKVGPVQALGGQVPQARAVQVTVTVKWSGSGVKGGDFTTSAIIAAP